MGDDHTVRPADADDFLAVVRVVEGALLDVDVAALRARLTDDADAGAWVAVDERRDDSPVVGALVVDGHHVEAVAVRRRHRGRGIGSALVTAALDARGRLTADFRSELRPFYASLGFRIDEREGRLWGVRELDQRFD